MKKTKKGLILLLVISTLLCQSCAGNGQSTEIEQTTEVSIQNESVSDLANEWVTAEDIIARGHVSLAYEYMNEASIAYNNEDGSKTLYVFSQSVNYINEHMKWSFIDTGIKEVDETRIANMGYQYTIEASDIKTYYPENLSPDLGVSLQKQLYQFGVVGDHNYAAEIVQKENFIQENREMIAYKGAVEGSDLFVYPSTLGTNAEIQIAQPFAKNQFQLWLEVEENTDVVKQPGGYLTIEARNNDETTIVGVIQKPLLKSAEGKHSYDSAIRSVRKTDDNRYVITFTINDEFNSSGTNVFLAFEVRREKQPDNCLYSKKPQLTHAYLANYSVIGNRGELLNGNSFITGVSGSGKSMMAKQELTSLLLSDKNADVIVIDPEREYTLLTEAFGGETVVVSATSNSHINAMAMSRDYADGANPVTLKSEFILSLCEQVMNGGLGAKEKSIIDRCTAIVYRDYMLGGCISEPPTLKDFREVLLQQSEVEAQDIALAIELFTDGSLNTFAKQTNVNTRSRFICYDIHELGKQLMPIGMLVVLDSILNRITENRAKGRKTYIFIDEIYLLFQHEYSANFLFTMWKKVRKYNAYILGITQNVEDLLQSHTARTMLANSELVIMLNQAATDREQLAELMGISDLQMSYITNVEAGHGLVKIGGALVPFVNNFPKDTQLYKLMTTKPSERL